MGLGLRCETLFWCWSLPSGRVGVKSLHPRPMLASLNSVSCSSVFRRLLTNPCHPGLSILQLPFGGQLMSLTLLHTQITGAGWCRRGGKGSVPGASVRHPPPLCVLTAPHHPHLLPLLLLIWLLPQVCLPPSMDCGLRNRPRASW